MTTTIKQKALRRDFDGAYAIMLVLFSVAYVVKVVYPHWGSFPLPPHHDIFAFAIVVGLSILARMFGGSKAVIITLASVATLIVLTISHEPLIRFLTLAGLLFSIGLYGMVVSRNAVRVLMSIELMLNAVNINLVTFARYVDPVQLKGQIFTIFILAVAAAEAAVGLAIVLAVYRNTATVDMERFNLLKW